jgi:hypothetical protein
MNSVIVVILSVIFHYYSSSSIFPCYRAHPFCYIAQPFFTVLGHFMNLSVIFPLLQYSIIFDCYNTRPLFSPLSYFCYSAQSFMIMSAILEPRGWEAARARARGSIACGLVAQLVMRAEPSCAGPSRTFDGVAQGMGSHRCGVGCAPVSVGLGGPLGLGDGPLVHHPR